MLLHFFTFYILWIHDFTLTQFKEMWDVFCQAVCVGHSNYFDCQKRRMLKGPALNPWAYIWTERHSAYGTTELFDNYYQYVQKYVWKCSKIRRKVKNYKCPIIFPISGQTLGLYVFLGIFYASNITKLGFFNFGPILSSFNSPINMPLCNVPYKPVPN